MNCRLGNPLGFAPLELYEFSHRFDDIHRRFRTLLFAEEPETALREVLADFRPNLAARQRHVERYGPEGADDFASQPVTEQWRIQNVLAPVRRELTGALIDLTDLPTRQSVEERTPSCCSSTASNTWTCTRSRPPGAR